MGTEDLGLHLHAIGDLSSAFKVFTHMREVCTTPSHVVSQHFKIISTAVDRGDWLGVQTYVHRVRGVQMKPEDQAKNQPKLSAALGLAALELGTYHEAANAFLQTDPSLGDTFNETITSNDVAVYGGLCALASMDRNELQRRVLDNGQFRNFLELEPHIRRAISFFCSSKFRSCLEILEAYRADYLLDLHLQRHVSTLYKRIRTKSIQQYLIPFSRVTLDAMAKTFAPTVVGGSADPTDVNSPFVQELIRLIEDGTLDARIDLEKRLIVSKQTDLRADVQKEALESVQDYVREAHLRLLRANILQAGLEVRPPPAAEGKDGISKLSRGPATWV
jgi:COP9 signalosome complex subunit 1